MKRNIWVFDVSVVVLLSFAVNYLISNSFDFKYGVISGQIVSIIMFVGICAYAVYRLTGFQKTKLKDFSRHFKTKLTLKQFFLVLLVFLVGKLSYSILADFEFIKGLNISRFLFVPVLLSPEQFHEQFFLIVMFAFLWGLLGVFAEEVFFRIYIFEAQYELYGRYAWIINAVSWASMHIFTKTNIIALLPFALMLSLMYQKKRSFWMVFCVHLVWNANAIFGVLLEYYRHYNV